MHITHQDRERKQPVTLSLRIGADLAARIRQVAQVSGGTRSEVARTWLGQMAAATDVRADRTTRARGGRS